MYSENYDVIVVGGGTSGVIAAIAAGREGAKTLLIERYGFLGGTATAGGLCNMASFFYKDEQVIKAFPRNSWTGSLPAAGQHRICVH